MISHQRCKHCYQRKGRSEQTMQCPARPAYGHEWESQSGNGITWDESLVGRLWNTRYGKIIVIVLGLLLYILLS